MVNIKICLYINIQTIIIPARFNYIILKKKESYLFFIKSKKFFFFFEISKYKLRIKKNSGGIVVMSEFTQITKNMAYTEFLINKTIKSWEFYFYKKFRFKSKGLKIKRKKKKVLKFFFWLSHINLAIIRHCKIRRIGKQKYVFISSNWIYLKKICKTMQDVRPNDLFTKKGIRFGRQIILKKRGKKVTYI